MSPHNFYIQKKFTFCIPIAGIKGQPETAYDWISFGITVVGRPGVRLSLFVYMKQSNNFIRGGIAANIVSEMLQAAGYSVYRFGYEGILQNLAQKDLPKMRKDSIVAEKIRTMPDFIVMDKDCNVFFIEVKYRSSTENHPGFKEWLRKAVRYWPEAKLLLLHPFEPYFQISTIKDFARTGKLYPLERDKFLHVNKKLIAHYVGLVKEFLE